MKIIKKIAAIMLSVMMVLGMCSVVGAAEAGTGVTGTIIIKNAIVDQTYKIYKILELESYDGDLYSYKPASSWEKFFDEKDPAGKGSDYITVDDNGYARWKGNETEDRKREFAKLALKYAIDNNIKEYDSDKASAEEGVTTTALTFDSLPLGYYLVDSSAGALCSLGTTNLRVEIQEKNGVPSVKKEVQEDSKGNSIDAWGNENTADIGQTVNFKTTITAQPGAQNYVLHDKMSDGLTFDKIDSVKVGNIALDVNTDYEVTDSKNTGDGCAFHITFTSTYCESIKNETNIVVSYSAILNDKAKIKTDENKNETWLNYGDGKESNRDSTITKTFEIPVFKYTKGASGTESDKGLAGAKFTLGTTNDGKNLINLVKTTGTGETTDTYRKAMETETGTITEVTTPSSGKFTIQGLDAGTYYLTETQQPAGYNKLKDPIQIKIDEAGVIKVVTDKEDEVTEVKVLNKTGSLLPNTGGMGTTLFYIFGAILVIGSGVVLITKKRMK